MRKGRVTAPVPAFYPEDLATFAAHALALGDQLLAHVDGAIRQRTASDPSRRSRGLAKRDVESAIVHMIAAVTSEWYPETNGETERNGR